MANPLRIGYLNRADDPGIVTASTAAALLPATNLQHPDVRILWRSTASPASIFVDMGQSLAVHAVALMQCNLAPASTFRVRVSVADPTAATNVHDSTALASDIDPIYPTLVYIIDSAATGRYVRIDLTQASPLPEAGRLFVGRLWSPTSNMQFGWKPASRDASRRTRSVGQATFIDAKERERGYRFRLAGLTEDEGYDEIEEINRLNGTKHDILVIRDRDSADLGRDTIWGLLENVIDYAQNDPLRFDADIEIWERL